MKEFSVHKNAMKIVVIIMLSFLHIISHKGACGFETVWFNLFSTHNQQLFTVILFGIFPPMPGITESNRNNNTQSHND